MSHKLGGHKVDRAYPFPKIPIDLEEDFLMGLHGLKCPICGGECVHIVGAPTWYWDEERPSELNHIDIPLEGECGEGSGMDDHVPHEFTLQIHFYKGTLCIGYTV